MKVQSKTGNWRFHETLTVALLLAVGGGFLDAYTYVTRGGVFANAQTGNMVLLAISAANGEWTRIVYYLVPIAVYFLGVFVAECIKRLCVKSKKSEFIPVSVVSAIECVLLLVIGFLPLDVPVLAVNTAISFICALQTQMFRSVHSLSYASTMCTGNLRSSAELLAEKAIDKKRGNIAKAGIYLFIIFFFIAGAALGGYLSLVFEAQAVWFVCALFVAVLAGQIIWQIILRLRERDIERHHNNETGDKSDTR